MDRRRCRTSRLWPRFAKRKGAFACRRGDHVLDLGANIGVSAHLFLTDGVSHVKFVEPNVTADDQAMCGNSCKNTWGIANACGCGIVQSVVVLSLSGRGGLSMNYV